MQIGMFKRAKNFDFVGAIATLALDAEFALKRIHSDNPKAPRFELLRKSTVHGKFVAAGGVWEQTSKRDGTSFYTATVRVEAFHRGYIQVSLFPAGDDLAIAWTPVKELAAKRAAARRADNPGSDNNDDTIENGGFGPSTADELRKAA